MNRAVRATLVGALVAWGTMIPSRAGGLELYEIGTQDGGLASAGYAARAQDPSTENGGNSVGALPAGSSSDNEALAKKLANPISSLISVPFQLNYDGGFGPDGEGDRWTLNIQPVIPITLNSEWNVISRTILPVISQDDLSPGAGSQFGLGDTIQSLFLSPQKPGPGGLIWGVGPVFLLPTGTDDSLGGQKWGAGPTAVVLKQEKGWTYGALANHIWSFAGDDDRESVNATFIQPFVAYTTPSAWTITLNSESTYDWDESDWSIPFNLTVSKVVRLGKLPVSIGGGVRYWADSPDNGPEGFGARMFMTYLFPRK